MHLQSRSTSHILQGTMRHQRHDPVKHDFSYPMTMWSLDLSEVNRKLDQHSGYSARGPAIARFRDRDYLPDHGSETLTERAKKLVHQQLGVHCDGRVQLVTGLRSWGISFNPVSFFEVFHQGKPRALIAEITNTPWHQRHCYVLPITNPDGRNSWTFDKEFHISPFSGMDHTYLWTYEHHANKLAISMCNRSKSTGKVIFNAQLHATVAQTSWWRSLWSMPLGCLQVLWRIYVQALRLRLKGAVFHPHPYHAAASPSQSLPQSSSTGAFALGNSHKGL